MMTRTWRVCTGYSFTATGICGNERDVSSTRPDELILVTLYSSSMSEHCLVLNTAFIWINSSRHICVNGSGQHWFGQCLVAYSVPNHYLNQRWVIVIWTPRNKLQWNFNHNKKNFIHENASENIFCEIVAILSRGRWVNPDGMVPITALFWTIILYLHVAPHFISCNQFIHVCCCLSLSSAWHHNNKR